MKELIQIVTVAILVEAITEIIKGTYKNKQVQWAYIVSIGVGLLFAFIIDFDLLTAIGLPNKYHLVGVFATGLIVSRGANYVNDLTSKLVVKPQEEVNNG